jgi:lipopolysaccharide export system permease protein
MTRLHRMILSMLPGPFVGWLGAIMFLLVMQFLMKYLPDIAGKGLPLRVILELIVYNLAYMLVLAVPMAVLVSTLMVFGRLIETRAYAVAKSAGISFVRLAWPTFLVGLIAAGGMLYFNNVILPEANFRARNLWQDISRKKPAFDLQAGAFYQGLNRYSILVQNVDSETGKLSDVTIYDYTASNRGQAVIKARYGDVIAADYAPYLELVLEDGEMHQTRDPSAQGDPERYERLSFDRHRFRIDLSDFVFERSDPTEGFRSDRTMRTDEMLRQLDSLVASSERSRQTVLNRDVKLATPPSILQAADVIIGRHDDLEFLQRIPEPAEETITTDGQIERTDVIDTALRSVRAQRTQIEDARRTVAWEQQRANRFRVEIHKKFSIAVACLIFALAGAPLGVSVRRGGLGWAAGVATTIFLFYWLTLVQGEKYADRGYIEPWMGMWAANIVIGIIAVAAMLYVTYDLRGTPLLRTRWSRRSK